MSRRSTQFRDQAVRHMVRARRDFQGDATQTLSLSDQISIGTRARLVKIEQLLRDGRDSEALLLANAGAWADQVCADRLGKANFNPDEPRDDRTKEWTRLGTGSNTAHVEEVQYRGYFHDVVVDDLIAGLNRSGGKAIKNIIVLGISGTVAIPDGASLPNSWTRPYFIEVKTGQDPKFTPNQRQVYSLICVGGHATSFDPRIKDLGLTPGLPFPPLDVLIAYTRGPGMPLSFHSYCLDFLEDGHAS